jgi:tetratricopeptide (TPR) repeat protein
MDSPTRVTRALALWVLVSAAAAGGSGCRQIRGRKAIQDANELYKKGHYVEAVDLFERAQALVPDLPVLWLNKGYTCRQLMTADRRFTACALEAFGKLKQVAPADARGDQLYMQTLFDADDFAALETIFLAQAHVAERRGTVDLDAATGLQQVYFKQGNWARALSWARKVADARTTDAEAQYRMGAFIWQLLSSRGGGAEMIAYVPRVKPPVPVPTAGPRAKAPPAPPPPSPPPAGVDDIGGALRIELADEGIHYLEKAMTLRPRHAEAMIYLNLLYRQKSLAFFDEPDKWQAAVDKANEWQSKGLETRGPTTKL